MKTALQVYTSKLKECRRLTVTDEIELASRHQAGDRQASKILVESVLPVIVHIVTRIHARFGGELEDMIQDASEAVIVGLDKFNPMHGRLSTWSKVCVKSWLRSSRQYAHRLKRNAPLVSAEEPVFEDVRVIDTLAAEESAVDERYEHFEASVAVYSAIQRMRLDSRDRLLLEQRFMADDPLPLSEIGRVLNITKQAVSHQEQILKQRIRNEVESVKAAA